MSKHINVLSNSVAYVSPYLMLIHEVFDVFYSYSTDEWLWIEHFCSTIYYLQNNNKNDKVSRYSRRQCVSPCFRVFMLISYQSAIKKKCFSTRKWDVNKFVFFWSVLIKLLCKKKKKREGNCLNCTLFELYNRLCWGFMGHPSQGGQWGIYYPCLCASHTRPVTMHSKHRFISSSGLWSLLQP